MEPRVRRTLNLIPAPMLAPMLVLGIALGACTPQETGDRWPRLMPLDEIFSQAPETTASPSAPGDLAARARALAARARLLATQPVIDPATRARLMAAVARHHR